MKKIIYFLLGFFLTGLTFLQAQTVSTFAGSGNNASTDGIGTAAAFKAVTFACLDNNGNMYVVDDKVIRKIVISTSAVTTLAGFNYTGAYQSVDGVGINASFNSPYGICFDGSNNLYVTDSNIGVLRRINLSTLQVFTISGSNGPGFVDGALSNARYRQPRGITCVGGNTLYVSDGGNHCIRKIDLTTNTVSIFAGNVPNANFSFSGAADGVGTAASFYSPQGIKTDNSGNLFVADNGNNKIRKIVIASAVVSTIAGTTNGFADGDATTVAKFASAIDVTIDAQNNIYVSDIINNRIRKISNGIVSTLAGTGTASAIDGATTVATFWDPQGIVLDGANALYICDTGNRKIRKIALCGTTAPTATAQSFCGATTIGSLVATGTAGATLNWYNAATGGTALATTTVLTSGNYYVASVGINGCESIRTNALVTIIPQDTPTFTQVAAICAGTSLAALPITSSNNVSGTWAPAIDATQTTLYTFTPTSGQCASIATMTIVVNPIPTVNAGNSPTPVCLGTNVTLTGTVSSSETLGFTAGLNIANWSTINTNSDGIVDTTAAPNSITISSGNNGSNTLGNTSYSIVIPANGTITFNWNYTTNDGPLYDYPKLVNNGVETLFTGYDVNGNKIQSGTMTVTVVAGQAFIFKMITLDNTTGAGTVQINNLIYSINNNVNWTTLDGTFVGPTNALSATVSAPGTYTITTTRNGCVKSSDVVVEYLTPLTPTFTQIAPTCQGDTIQALPTTSNNNFTGSWSPALDNSTTTTYTFTPDAGQCANTASMTIVINPSTENVITASACDSYVYNGNTYTQSGIYTGTTTNCVTEKLNLTVNAKPAAPISGGIDVVTTGNCLYLNGTYNFNGLLNGKNTYSYNNSIVTFNISFDGTKWIIWFNNINNSVFQNSAVPNGLNPPTIGWTNSSSICIGNLNITLPATTSTFCSGKTVADLTPVPSATIKWYDVATGGTELDNTTILASGNYYVSQTSASGCESDRSTVAVTVNPSSDNITVISACDSYSWNGQTYTATGIYTGTTTNCVTDVLKLNITPSSDNVRTEVACESYVWNGTTYTQSGIYTGTTTNCVTEKLNLTINAKPAAPANDSIDVVVNGPCNNFNGRYISNGLLNGKKTFVNGIYNISFDGTKWVSWYYFINGGEMQNTTSSSSLYPPATGWTATGGCTQSVLTIVSSTNYSNDNTFCSGKTVADLTPAPSTTIKWYDVATGGTELDSTTILATGNYFVSQTSASGCESDRSTVAVTVNPSSDNITVISACDSYSWNGQTYTTTGIYTGTTTNCVTDVLKLNITPSSDNVRIEVACESYVWNGTTYTQSGIYTGTTTNCVTEKLDLTINPIPAQPTTACYETATFNTTSCAWVVTGTQPAAPTANATQNVSAGATIADLTASGTLIQWYASATSTTALPTTTVLINGTTYYASQTINGCESNRTAVLADVALANNTFESNSKLLIYPNPFTNSFIVKIDNDSKIEIYDMVGKFIQSNKITTGENVIDMNIYASGVYLLKVLNDNGTNNSFKIIKK